MTLTQGMDVNKLESLLNSVRDRHRGGEGLAREILFWKTRIFVRRAKSDREGKVTSPIEKRNGKEFTKGEVKELDLQRRGEDSVVQFRPGGKGCRHLRGWA